MNVNQLLTSSMQARTYAGVVPCPLGSAQARGFSLVELMVALTISAIILIALVTIFMGNRSTYQLDEGLARLQENARFALEYLTRDIRMAGYAGCHTNNEELRVVNYLAGGRDPQSDIINGIWGFEYQGTGPGATYTMPNHYPVAQLASNANEWLPLLDTSLLPATSVVQGTDVLVISLAGDPNDPPVRVAPPFRDAASFTVFQPNNIKNNQILMVTNCKQAAIFQATNVTNIGGGKTNIVHSMAGNVTPGNRCAVWGSPQCPEPNDFGDGSEIMGYSTVVYYIGRGTSGRPALYRDDLELVEGVESMQILFGIDTDGDPKKTADRYVTASGVTDWRRVVSARVDLLVTTSNVEGSAEQTTDTASYTLAEATFTPSGNDRLRRRTFTTTVRLRNREG